MSQHGRSIAFSNKQKKEQLKAKRERKKLITSDGEMRPTITTLGKRQLLNKLLPQARPSIYLQEVEEINVMPHSTRNSRYNLKFKKNNRPKLCSGHHEEISVVPVEELEKDYTFFFPEGLNYPCRPPWKKNMSKADLEQSENRNFRLFCEDLDRKYEDKELSLYELNLETWRQLWRVTEMSDILLIIVDARFPVAQFPPYLYIHLVEKEHKRIILILNKCDLISPSLVIAWQDYFTNNFPKLHVVPFSSLERKSIKKTTLVMSYESAVKLVEACDILVKGNVDLSSWRQKIEDERNSIESKCSILNEHEIESTLPELFQKYKDGILTIGTIGHPNVGKSSVINALMGKKVVSVSKTPGHTKYFQTIFLTKNIKLCDCPGLVFPSLCPKEFQILLGSYPISQVRDPISAISYLASRLDLATTLKLQPPEGSFSDANTVENFKWTPFYICEAWAIKRGYFTRTKGGRPDVYRAANELLRYALVGFKNLIITLHPPGYNANKEKYDSDPRQMDVAMIQGIHSKCNFKLENSESDELSSDDNEDDGEKSDTGTPDENDLYDSSDDNEKVPSTSCSNKFALLNLED